MGRGKVVLGVVALLAVGGPLEAAGGGRMVRAAVRLQNVLEARVADPVVRTRLDGEAESLVTALRAVRHADRDARCLTYSIALARVRGINAALPPEVTGRARARLLHAVTVLERALERHGRAACP